MAESEAPWGQALSCVWPAGVSWDSQPWRKHSQSWLSVAGEGILMLPYLPDAFIFKEKPQIFTREIFWL